MGEIRAQVLGNKAQVVREATQTFSRPSNGKQWLAINRGIICKLCNKPGAQGTILDLEDYLGMAPNIVMDNYRANLFRRPQFTALLKLVWPVTINSEELIKNLHTDLNQPNRPNSLNEFFRSDKFTQWYKKYNFTSLADFSKAVRVNPIVERTNDPKHPKQYRIDLINLGEAIWPLPGNDEILEGIRKIQVNRPQCLEEFFNSDAFRTWLNDNNFATPFMFFDYMACIKPSPSKQPHRQPHFDLLQAAAEIWPVSESKDALLADFRQRFHKRPVNLAEFYASQELRAWLKMHNMRAAADFMRVIGVSVKTVRMLSGTKNKFKRHQAAALLWGEAAGVKRAK